MANFATKAISYFFGNGEETGLINTSPSSGGQRECGYVTPEASGGVAGAYVVTISSKKWRVKAVLQDNISMRVESTWKALEDLAPSGDQQWAALGGAIAQALTKKALVTAFTSRRIWGGTSPVELILPLRFEAIKDPQVEVVQPCLALQQMALPTKGEDSGFLGVLPLLQPPGPSPFQTGLNSEAGKQLGAGEDITITVGNLLTFKSVVVHNVTVTFDTRYTAQGLPISAKVDIAFQTYEIVTKEGLAEIYNGGSEAFEPIR